MGLEVYKITNKINGKIYIGITSQGVITRWSKHCSDGLYGNSNFPIHNAIRKYGKDNFQIDLIEDLSDKDYDYLKEREIYWIKEFDSYNREKGYNLTLGGDGAFGRVISEKTRSRMSASAKNRKYAEGALLSFSINSSKAKRISQYSTDGVYLKTYRSASDAARQLQLNRTNIAACARGKYKQSGGFVWKYTDKQATDILPEIKIAHKEKSTRKITVSEDTRNKISRTNKLRWAENPNRRVTASIDNHKNRPILQYNLDGVFLKEFRNVAEATKEVGASTHTNIAKCARGLRKKSCGYIWRYKEENLNK